jgi:hypothetical protein
MRFGHGHIEYALYRITEIHFTKKEGEKGEGKRHKKRFASLNRIFVARPVRAAREQISQC